VTAGTPLIDLRFPHTWQAKVLAARPMILPTRHYTYPRDAEEVERGALEVLIQPGGPGLASETWETTPTHSTLEQPGAQGGPGLASATWDSTTASSPAKTEQPFLATCALGFRDPAAPTGLWSTPEPAKICAVSGGYAYLIDTTAPERFTMIPYRPVLAVYPALEENLLLFVGHRTILAWGSNGQAWESGKLSDEGVTIANIEKGVLRGSGWTMKTDKESPFALDIRIGKPIA
jgi:hypothetical protein